MAHRQLPVAQGGAVRDPLKNVSVCVCVCVCACVFVRCSNTVV